LVKPYYPQTEVTHCYTKDHPLVDTHKACTLHYKKVARAAAGLQYVYKTRSRWVTSWYIHYILNPLL